MPTTRDFLLASAGIGLLIVGVIVGRGCSPSNDGVDLAEQNEILRQQLESLRVDYEGVAVVDNTHVESLQEVIDMQGDKLDEMSDIILKMRDQPAKVKYITNTVTIIERETQERTVTVKDLPPEKLFGLPDRDGNLVVLDRMTASDTDGDGVPDLMGFNSYNVTMEYDAALSEETSGFLLRIKSSYDDTFRSFPVKAEVMSIGNEEDANSHKVVEPQLALQVAGQVGTAGGGEGVNVGYTGGLSMPWLHPVERLDVMSPSIMVGASHPIAGQTSTIIRAGVTAASYNVGGGDSSFLKDTWVGVDAGVGSDGSLTGGVTLGTKL